MSDAIGTTAPADEEQMEVDESQRAPDQRVLVHPLAIVNMSDQYTRITYGGSPLPPDAPVTGLLFGSASATPAASGTAITITAATTTTTTTILEIVDAEDIPVDRSEAALLQEELHRAVFPLHRVIGWYRVSDAEEVLPSDVVLTQQLEQHYCGSPDGYSDAPFVFALLVLDPAKLGPTSDDSKPPAADAASITVASAAAGSTLADAPLPLTLFRRRRDSHVLQALDEWTLDTWDSERVSVEHILREQPPSRPTTGRASEQGTGTAVGGAAPAAESPFVQHALAVEHSLQAILDRLDVLHQFLRETVEGTNPFHPALMRQVHGLLLQLGPIASQAQHACQQSSTANVSSSSHPSSLSAPVDPKAPDRLLIPIATLAQAIEAIQSYTDKFRLVHEGGAASASTSTSSLSQQAVAAVTAAAPGHREVRQL